MSLVVLGTSVKYYYSLLLSLHKLLGLILLQIILVTNPLLNAGECIVHRKENAPMKPIHSPTILDSSSFPLFQSSKVFHELVCPLTVVLPQISFNLTTLFSCPG